jgi:hypothetical protein
MKKYDLDDDAKRRLASVHADYKPLLLELYQHAMRNEHDPEFNARMAREAKEKELEEKRWYNNLRDIVGRALDGHYGNLAQTIAHRYTNDGCDLSKRTIIKTCRRLRGLPKVPLCQTGFQDRSK